MLYLKNDGIVGEQFLSVIDRYHKTVDTAPFRVRIDSLLGTGRQEDLANP